MQRVYRLEADVSTRVHHSKASIYVRSKISLVWLDLLPPDLAKCGIQAKISESSGAIRIGRFSQRPLDFQRTIPFPSRLERFLVAATARETRSHEKAMLSHMIHQILRPRFLQGFRSPLKPSISKTLNRRYSCWDLSKRKPYPLLSRTPCKLAYIKAVQMLPTRTIHPSRSE